MLVFKVPVGLPTDSDVTERRLTVTVNGGEPTVHTYPAQTDELGPIKVPRNAKVDLHLVDVDGDGNVSEAATTSFTAKDTLAPAKPGAFAATLISQEEAEVLEDKIEAVVDAEPADEVSAEEVEAEYETAEATEVETAETEEDTSDE